MSYELQDHKNDGRRTIAVFPTFRTAFNAARKLEPDPTHIAAGSTHKSWRYQVRHAGPTEITPLKERAAAVAKEAQS